MNPPKILNSAGNLREIPKESSWKIHPNFHKDSRFTYNPNYPVDSLHHVSAIPGDSPQNPCDFARWGIPGCLQWTSLNTMYGCIYITMYVWTSPTLYVCIYTPARFRLTLIQIGDVCKSLYIQCIYNVYTIIFYCKLLIVSSSVKLEETLKFTPALLS